MGFYDFAVELKRKYNESKTKTAQEVGYSLKYVPYILQETARIYNKHHKKYDFNELLSVAFTASLEAEIKYDPELYAFTTYARWYIDGALNDHVSSMSKSQLKLQTRVQTYIDKYFAANALYPSRQCILKDLGISEESFRNLINSSSEITYIDDEETELISTDSTQDDYLDVLDIHKALDYIDIDYSGVLRMHLVEELPFFLIGKKINKSKAQVQSLYCKAIISLQHELIHRGLHD